MSIKDMIFGKFLSTAPEIVELKSKINECESMARYHIQKAKEYEFSKEKLLNILNKVQFNERNS